MKNIIAGLLFIVAAALLFIASQFFNGKDLFNFNLGDTQTVTHRQSFSDTVGEDLEIMHQKKLLPKEWDQVQYATYIFESPTAQQLVNTKSVVNKFNPNGNLRLELLFMDLPDEENPSVILQMSIFDIASQNKVWELGKNYSIVPYLKKEKPTKQIAQKQRAQPQTPTTENSAPTQNPPAQKKDEKKPGLENQPGH